MKRRLNTLKGKKLVTGDPNLMTKDEICINATPNGIEVKEIGTDGKIKDLAGSSNNGGGGGVKEYYYYYVEEYNMFKELIKDLSLVTLNGYLITKQYGEEKYYEGT